MTSVDWLSGKIERIRSTVARGGLENRERRVCWRAKSRVVGLRSYASWLCLSDARRLRGFGGWKERFESVSRPFSMSRRLGCVSVMF